MKLTLEKALGDSGGQATHKVLVSIDNFDSVETVHYEVRSLITV